MISRTSLLAALAFASTVEAQSLTRRIDAVADGRVQFHFAARDGVCGNGSSMLVIGSDTYIGQFSGTVDRDRCQEGPVKVVVDRAGRQEIGITTSVGPLQATDGALNLGEVSPAEAAEYLLGVAARADGRPSRDAIMPAAIGRGVSIGPKLLVIARDRDRPAETRRSALSWFGRSASTAGEARDAAGVLTSMARDAGESNTIRQQALSVMGRLDHGAGVPQLVSLVRPTTEPWLLKESAAALGRSGDPRARAHLRAIVENPSLADEPFAVVVRALGQQYATADDIALLKSSFARMPGERSRSAVISAVANAGGTDNARWLLGVVANADQSDATRRSALSAARRAGVPVVDLVRLYDRTEGSVRVSLISALSESREPAAVEKLIAIARSTEDRALRRRAISALGRVDDPKAKAALAEIVVQ